MIDRQTIVTLAVKATYTSKARPLVVIQSDDFRGTDSVILCAFTHALNAGADLLRIDVSPSAGNGLLVPSQLQAEKVVTVRRSDLGSRIGRLEDEPMRKLESALRDIIGL